MSDRRCTICSSPIRPDQLSRCSDCVDFTPFIAGGQGRTCDEVHGLAISWAETTCWIFGCCLAAAVALWVIGGVA